MSVSAAPTPITPIFILGAKHSGTTILYRMVARHPIACWFSQFSQRSGQVPGRFRVPLSFAIDRALRSCVRHSWDKDVGFRQYVIPHPTEAPTIWTHVVPPAGGVVAEESKRRLRRILEEECARWRKSVIVTKLPRLYQHMGMLRDAYPQARIVHIVRDGRAVALSDRSTFAHRAESSEHALRLAALYWNEVVNTVYECGRDVLEVRYEDLCADVRKVVRTVLDYCGLPAGAFPYDTLPATLRSTNPHRLRSASEGELKRIEDLQLPLLRRYGYRENAWQAAATMASP